MSVQGCPRQSGLGCDLPHGYSLFAKHGGVFELIGVHDGWASGSPAVSCGHSPGMGNPFGGVGPFHLGEQSQHHECELGRLRNIHSPRRVRARAHQRTHHRWPGLRTGPRPRRRKTPQNDPSQAPPRHGFHGQPRNARWRPLPGTRNHPTNPLPAHLTHRRTTLRWKESTRTDEPQLNNRTPYLERGLCHPAWAGVARRCAILSTSCASSSIVASSISVESKCTTGPGIRASR